MKSPVRRVVTSTPTVESRMPWVSTGRISVNLVSIPPVKRMMLSAIMPMNCASVALWNWSPSPSLPKSMPTSRKRSSVGMPKR